MPPQQPNLLTQAIKTFSDNYSNYIATRKAYYEKHSTFKRPSLNIPSFKLPTLNHADMPNPVQSIMKGLASTLSQITQKPVREDSLSIAKRFLPDQAVLLKPKYPKSASEIQMADMDGDSENEMVATYKLHDEITTLILKKQNSTWRKIDEIHHLGHDRLLFRDIVDVVGGNRDQLLLGLSSKEQAGVLYGYTLENNNADKLFDHAYHRFDILPLSKNGKRSSQSQLAIWKKNEQDCYEVELLRWNGLQLEPLSNIHSYYQRSVVPYQVDKVKQTPNSPSSWYQLANALEKAGFERDALIAVDMGMRLKPDIRLLENFSTLKSRLLDE